MFLVLQSVTVGHSCIDVSITLADIIIFQRELYTASFHVSIIGYGRVLALNFVVARYIGTTRSFGGIAKNVKRSREKFISGFKCERIDIQLVCFFGLP